MNTKRMFLKALTGGAVFSAIAGFGLQKPAASRPAAGRYPKVWLKTHEGKDVRLYEDLLMGKNVLINMMYTMCTVNCPPSTASLLQVQEAFGARIGRDIHMYSISLRPEMDTPELLRTYMKQYDIKPGWTFLTGRPADVEQVRRGLGFADSDPEKDADISNHTGMVRIGSVPLDRWSMVPAQSSRAHLLASINGVF